jgi:hypothetical protein
VIYHEEAVLPQRFALDIAAHLNLGPAGRSDDLSLSVSYADMVAWRRKRSQQRRFQLIEAAAEAVGGRASRGLSGDRPPGCGGAEARGGARRACSAMSPSRSAVPR